MKNITTVFTLSFLITLTLNLTAQVDWTKYEDNPILEPGAPGTWNDYSQSPTCILFDGSTYQLWYGGHDGTTTRIGYATSPDGITWIEYENNPIFNPGPSGSWDEWVSNPYVLFDGSTYHMYYAGNDGTNTRIGYATSSDAITWTRYEGNPIMDKGTAGSWENVGVWPDCIYYDEDTYHMWYGADDGTNIKSRIGYAFSTDGITWTKYEGNPVLKPNPGKWDQAFVGAPHVFFHDDVYHMWYTGSNSGLDWQWDGIGYATSPDGITWTKHAENPILSPDAGEWDSQYVGFSRVLWDSTTSQFKMWYGGGSSDWYAKMGYATAPDTITSGIHDVFFAEIPDNFILKQNYPNPFNPLTTIQFQIPNPEFTSLKIYNILGKEVSTLVSKKLNPGNHTYQFDGKNLASGLYYYQLVAGDYQEVKKMILLK